MYNNSPSYASHLTLQEIRAKLVNMNKDNLPTYFQIGRNSVEAGERLYKQESSNKGLYGVPNGKKPVPIASSVLARSDSSDRLNLN